MGWSCRTDAARTMQTIENACRRQQSELGNPSSNVFISGEATYFYEISRRDQTDGGISGAIWQYVGETHARKSGSFRISGDGKLVRGPAFFRKAVEGIS